MTTGCVRFTWMIARLILEKSSCQQRDWKDLRGWERRGRGVEGGGRENDKKGARGRMKEGDERRVRRGV